MNDNSNIFRHLCRPVIATTLVGILLLGGCGSAGQKGAIAGAAVGSGIGLATGGGFTRTIGGGLIGGGLGYLGGEALGGDN